jgi:hypothetical protein
MKMYVAHRMREVCECRPTHRSGTSLNPSTTWKMKRTHGDEVSLHDSNLIMRFHEVLESCGKSGYENPLCVRDVVMSRRLRPRQQRRTVY